MKKVTYFMFEGCPHCKLADQLLAELRQNPEYASVEIEKIDERLQPEIADRYDYYYVPTFYVADQKVHEGHAEKEDVQKVLDLALDVK